MQDFKLISGTVPKADTGDKEGQKKRRDKIRKLENIYLTKVEKYFKNGVNGFKILFKEQKNKDDYIKKYTVIKPHMVKRIYIDPFHLYTK